MVLLICVQRLCSCPSSSRSKQLRIPQNHFASLLPAFSAPWLQRRTGIQMLPKAKPAQVEQNGVASSPNNSTNEGFLNATEMAHPGINQKRTYFYSISAKCKRLARLLPSKPSRFHRMSSVRITLDTGS